MHTDNTLLVRNGLIAYNQVTLEYVRAAIDQVIEEHESGIERIITHQQSLPTWDDLVLAVDDLDARLQGVLYSIVPLITWGEDWAVAVVESYERVDARFKQ